MRTRDILLAAALALTGAAATADEASDDAVTTWRTPGDRTGLPQIEAAPYAPPAEAAEAPQQQQNVQVEVRIVDERNDLRPPTQLFVPYEAYRYAFPRGDRRHRPHLRVLTPIPKNPIDRRIAERANIDHIARVEGRAPPPPPPDRVHRPHAPPQPPYAYRDDPTAEFTLRIR